jgi:arsenate reductase-like glutaredoxin family protein
MKWLEEKLIPNLEPNSVLIIDNASYHNVTVLPNPTSSWKKANMQQWLNERGIPFELHETKPELYSKIKLHKPVHKLYAVDSLMAHHGHSVLRLPPYHPELNPIEKIWAQVKNYVATHNVTFKFDDMRKLAEEKFAIIGTSEWENVCRNAIKVEDEYLSREAVVDEVQELVIRVNTGESDEESDFFSDNDPVDDV